MHYLSVAEARDLPGLRLVLTAHLPAPWGEAAKAVFRLRGIPYVAVEQMVLEPNAELSAWTGFRNAPVAVYEDEPAVAGWREILMLAERLGSGPSLLPSDPVERALSLGFSSEICGPDGFGWNRRLVMSTDFKATSAYSDNPGYRRIMQGYGVTEEAQAAASGRVVSILSGLARQLHDQKARGSAYLVGDRLSACDVHWACLSEMVAPPAHEDCPMPDWMRRNYANVSPEIAAALDPILLEHRDVVLRRHVGLPMDF